MKSKHQGACSECSLVGRVDDSDTADGLARIEVGGQQRGATGVLGGNDVDGDGTPNAGDACPLLEDDQADFDGDGYGDACDCNSSKTDWGIIIS